MVRIKYRYLLVHIFYPSTPSVLGDAAAAEQTLLDVRKPSPEGLDAGKLNGQVRDAVVEMFGDLGAGKIIGGGLHVKYFSPATSTFIIRSPRAHYRLLWTALTSMTYLRVAVPAALPTPGPALTASEESRRSRRPASSSARDQVRRVLCVMQVVRVSGTMKLAELEAIRRAKELIVRARKEDAEGGAGGVALGPFGMGLDDGGISDDDGQVEDESEDEGSSDERG